MQFTPQQLVGGARFSKEVKIGNWSEDLELEDLKLKEYLSKKEHGELLVNSKQKKLEQALNVVSLTSLPKEAELSFGSTVMLVNHKSEAFLSVNPFERIPKEETARGMTSSHNASPCGRNTFVIERASTRDGFAPTDNLVHYGQNLYLRLEPFSDVSEPHYMHSEHISALAAAKFSRKHEVVMFPRKNGNVLFQFSWADVKQRFEIDGHPVKASFPLCIRHVHTGSFLASDKIVCENIFGCEYEVHCHNYVSTNKTQNLFSERKGQITGDYPLRRQGVENLWTVVGGN